jgi:hypothetical protein
MPFTAEDIADVPRVRAVMESAGPDRHVSQVFDLRDDENESLMSIALKCMAIDVVIGREAPAKARAFAGMFTLVDGGAEVPYPVQAVLDACDYVETESA